MAYRMGHIRNIAVACVSIVAIVSHFMTTTEIISASVLLTWVYLEWPWSSKPVSAKGLTLADLMKKEIFAMWLHASVAPKKWMGVITECCPNNQVIRGQIYLFIISRETCLRLVCNAIVGALNVSCGYFAHMLITVPYCIFWHWFF